MESLKTSRRRAFPTILLLMLPAAVEMRAKSQVVPAWRCWTSALLMLALFLVQPRASAGISRERTLIDAGWKFYLGDPTDITNASETNVTYYPEIANLAKLQANQVYGSGSETNLMTLRPPLTGLGENVSFVQTNFNDSSWRSLNLPHDWVVELPFSSSGDKGHGYKAAINGSTSSNTIAWYRRTFTLPSSYTNSTVSLEFDGVYRNCLVWLNGHIIGRNVSGYSSFSFDISQYANPGGTNVLVVRVDASRFEGWFYEGAGIYRHVWLVKSSPVHVAHWGTYVTNLVSGSNATVTIQTQINNDGSNSASGNLISAIYDPNSNLVATATGGFTIAAGTNQVLSQSVTITNALLWSLDFPNLYQLNSTVTQGGATNDACSTPFGVRTFSWDVNNGLFLNGQHVQARGVCNHQDFEGVGLAQPDRVQYFRVERIKALGFNAIRTSHNSPAPEVADACDKLGILLLDENRRFGNDPETLSEVQRGIARDRNHPSVFAWSLANEETLQGTSTGAVVVASMQTLAHQLDPSRLCTVAMNGSWGNGISTVIDVQGFNYHEGNESGFHSSHPSLPSIATEDGSQVGDRGVYTNQNSYETAYDTFNSGVGWSATAEGMVQFYNANTYVAGFFDWTGFDYRGEPTPSGWPTINSHFGILDMCGFPKDNGYYFQANWLSKPVLHIFPHWNWAGKEGQAIDIWCFSSCDSVELFLNGVSQGAQTVNVQSHLEWNVPYAAGALQAIGYRYGQPVITNTIATTGSPSRIVLQPDRSTIVADGKDVSLVTVSVVDSQGQVVPTATNAITFTVTGGTLLGLGNGDANDHESDKATNNVGVRSVFNGLAQVIVQSTNQIGSITLTASAAGLGSTNITLSTSSAAVPPNAPTGLLAPPNDQQVTLGWDLVPGALGYNVKRAVTSGGPYTLIASNTADLGWTDTNVSNGTTYYYVVSAVNGAGESPNSTEVSIIPGVPLHFVIQPASNSSSVGYAGLPITLSALASGVPPISYQWYKIIGGLTNAIAGATNSVYVYVVQGGDTNGPGFFAVAINGSGSITSHVANLNFGSIVPVSPSAPVSIQFTITNYSGYSGFSLAPAETAGVFAASNWNVWPITPGTNTTQPGVTRNNLHDWNGTATSASATVVNVSDGWHQSQAASNSASANARMMNTYWKVNPAKSNPSVSTMYITLTNVPNGAYAAYVYFMQNQSGPRGHITAGSYTYYFSEFTAFNSSSNFVTAADTTGATNPLVNFLQIPGISTGGTNSVAFTIVYSSGGDGIGVCGLQLVPLLTAPAGLTATTGYGQVALVWNPVFGATGYNILRATASGGPYQMIATNLNATNYADTTVLSGVTYYYIIAAVNGPGQPVGSAPLTATTPLSPPVSLAVTPFTVGQFGFQFASITGLTYVVEASTNLSAWTPIFTNTAGSTQFLFQDNNLLYPNRFYRVHQW
jgi:beta-galactosidase